MNESDDQEIMNEATTCPAWEEPGWLDRVTAWIYNELDTRGRPASGPIQQPHTRPWSTILRVPTNDGTVYFKACAGILAHEVNVTTALSTWLPDSLPTILASAPGQGWMLMADGGTTVRNAWQDEEDSKTEVSLRHWKQLLPRHAELQIAAAAHLDELLAAGLPDRRLAVLPNRIESLLDETDALLIGQKDGLTAAEHKRLNAFMPQLTTLCDELSAMPIPESIHHGDFHDANVFVSNGQYVFFDWGDASAAHPFFSLRTAFVVIEYFQGIKPEDPKLDELRDAYLEPWTQFGSRDELVSAFELSKRLSPLTSALGWNRVVSSLGEAQRAEYAAAVPSLLKEFLDLEVAARN